MEKEKGDVKMISTKLENRAVESSGSFNEVEEMTEVGETFGVMKKMSKK